MRARVERAIASAHADAPLESAGAAPAPGMPRTAVEVAPEPGTQLEAINRALGEWMAADPARADLYDALYREYLELHDHFGRGGTAMMSRLRRLAH